MAITTSKNLTHIDPDGNPAIVDVSDKLVSKRTAIAISTVILPDIILALFSAGEIIGKKGPVFQTAIIAGTMAAKRTSELIPLCHPIGIEDCKIKINLTPQREVQITCEVTLHGKTGVEMEALTGVSVAALTIYDMCKALSPQIIIKETRLLKKTGGKSDFRA